jgi:hypothetical protein
VGTSHSQTDNQTPSVTQSYRQPNTFGHSQADSQTPSVEQTTCSKHRQYLYTAACGLAARTPTQALANQHPQLQLRLQLARTQPSGNGIKMRASNRPASVPAVPSSLAAPLSARVRHGSSPTCEGSNSTHRRPSTLSVYAWSNTQHAATLRTLGRRLPRARTGSCQPTLRRIAPKEDRQSVRPPVSPVPPQVPTGISSPQSPGCHKRRRSYKTPLFRATTSDSSSGPFKGHYTGILQWRAPLGFPGHSDIITVTNICYSNTWVSAWIPTSHTY